MNFDIRQSQVIHTWPAGSIIDLPQLSLIMLCHDDGSQDWGTPDIGAENPNRQITINDPRLAEAFKVTSFIVPPIFDGLSTARTYGIRFPAACYCPKCGLMEVSNKTRGREKTTNIGTFDYLMKPFWCRSCFNNQLQDGPVMVPMRFVIATENGFLDDFPWDWYVHERVPEERGRGNRLYYRSKGGSASLSDIVIRSERADGTYVAHKDLSEIFDQEIFARDCPEHGHYLNYVRGMLSKPWKGYGNDGTFHKDRIDIPTLSQTWDGEEMSRYAKTVFPRTMQRGAGNLIFPIIYSSILLPQGSYEQSCPPQVRLKIEGHISNRLEDSYEEYQDYTNSDWKKMILGKLKNPAFSWHSQLGYSPSELEIFIRSYFGDEGTSQPGKKAALLRQQEYKAFLGADFNNPKTWFKKRNLPGRTYNETLGKELLKSVVLLDELSAIKVFRGFTRIKPLMTEELIFADPGDGLDPQQTAEFHRIQDARKTPLQTHQLPAVEVRGEGIFLEFNSTLLAEWSDRYDDARLGAVNANILRANADFNQANQPINKRYLFLHTLSHILLKELSEDCGYSTSSLAEIIYCSEEDEAGSINEMNGILIYTTTSDSEGSLGGLVEKGLPEYLIGILNRGVDKARWCSSDPLCISASGGQGFLGLNLAACYSCILLPETSCEKMNKYLDRASLVGTLEDEQMGMFNN
ncbi:DUF1998 domain-containing protein [Pedobacter agri]|uniref:DUF1998 domain-containing protein n=1 Tax=Pedobacter agri TaxID=454586 RepID=A0A9X3I7Z8_9SPHI|nr:DUF1998 domain-containing protein [Pedobacter agri]MCX3263710.1 DUF1998 domain-containing protein [Pedobacter agri]